jgi:hypothetical protein
MQHSIESDLNLEVLSLLQPYSLPFFTVAQILVCFQLAELRPLSFIASSCSVCSGQNSAYFLLARSSVPLLCLNLKHTFKISTLSRSLVRRKQRMTNLTSKRVITVNYAVGHQRTLSVPLGSPAAPLSDRAVGLVSHQGQHFRGCSSIRGNDLRQCDVGNSESLMANA